MDLTGKPKILQQERKIYRKKEEEDMKQNMVKKVLACLLTATMTVGLSACGGSDGTNSGDAGRISSDQVKEDNQAADDGSSDS